MVVAKTRVFPAYVLVQTATTSLTFVSPLLPLYDCLPRASGFAVSGNFPSELLYSSSWIVDQSAIPFVIGLSFFTNVRAMGTCGPCPVLATPVNSTHGVVLGQPSLG